MKRQSQVLLAVALVAAGAAGCFKDPVDSLRNGPAVLSVNQSAVYVKSGDSTAVIAYLKDSAGNVLPATDPSWTSTDPLVAVVNVPKDASGNPTPPIPGFAYTRANIRGVDSVSGGQTTVIVSSRGIVDTIRVVVLPARLTLQHVSYLGPTLTDTVIKGPDALIPGDTTKRYSYSAQDTLVLSGTTTKLTFDTSKVTVQVATTNGASKGLIVSKTPSTLKVVFQAGTAGKVMVQHLLLNTGDAAVGTIKVDTLIGDSVHVAAFRINPATFGGGAAVANNIVTVTAPPGMTFSSASTASFGGAPAPVVAQTPTSLSAISSAVGTVGAAVVVYKVGMASTGTGVTGVTFDSISTNDQAYTLSQAGFPDAGLFSPNNGLLGDTIILTAPTGMSFATSGAVSKVIFGNPSDSTSDTAWTVSVTADTLKALAKRGGTSKIVATNMSLSVPGAVPFALSSLNPQTIASVGSDFPAGVDIATARPLTIPANDTAVAYGGLPPAGADFWTFTTVAAHVIKGTVAWFGSGNPGGTGLNTTAYTEDIDMLLCNAATACDESGADLTGFAAAKATQPETFTTTSRPADQYWIGILGFNVNYTIGYRLTIILQ